MKVYASLHTAAPSSQTSHEVSYKGYQRLPVEHHAGFGEDPVHLVFPEVLEEVPGSITHICLGTAETGDGEVILTVLMLPWEDMKLGNSPKVTIAIIPHPPLPEHVNPIARVAHALISTGQMRAECLHPALYEAINDALANAGCDVIPVIRSGAADMKQTQGWGLADLGEALGQPLH